MEQRTCCPFLCFFRVFFSCLFFFFFFYIFEYSPSIDHLQSCRHGIAVCVSLSKLDYCTVPLLGLPEKQIKRLQAVLDAAARIVYTMKCRKTDHVIPIFRELHWFAVQKRTRHKILMILTGLKYHFST